jgi:hypothetical protein
MNKREMISVLDHPNKIDVGIPIQWSAEAKDCQIDPSDYAWDYREDNFMGKPVNLYKGYAMFLEESNKAMVNRIHELTQKLDDKQRNS